MTLTIDGEYILIDDINMSMTLDMIKVATEYIGGEEEDYLTTYGIVIEEPEDAVKDNEFKIVIPDEELTADITIRAKPKAEAKTE